MDKAIDTAHKLDKALDVAAKKCDKNKQKETLAGIQKYKTVVNAYKAAVMKGVLAGSKREKLLQDMTPKSLQEDSALWKIYGHYFDKKRRSPEQFNSYEMIRANKMGDAVKSTGKQTRAARTIFRPSTMLFWLSIS